MLGITAHIGEWQHGNRRFVGEFEHRPTRPVIRQVFLEHRGGVGLWCRYRFTWLQFCNKNPYRLIEPFHGMLAQALECEWQSYRHRLGNGPLNDHATGFSKLLETLSQDHSCTGDCTVCNHNLSQADPNPKVRSNIVGQILVVVGVLDLEGQRCTNGIRSTRELGNERIPPYLVRDSTVSLGCVR